MHPFLQSFRPTLHISHRGGAKVAPENTLLAFDQAVRSYRTQMIELDVHQSADQELVVAHDATLERCTNGDGPLASRTVSQLQALDAGYRFTADGGKTFPFRKRGARIPTLREVLRAFPTLPLNIELKADVPGIEGRLATLLREENAVHRVCVGSELDDLAARISAALPEACCFYPAGALAQFVLTARSGVTPRLDPRFTVVDMPLYWEGTRLVDEAFLDVCSRTGRWVNVWTVDDAAEMEKLVQEGVGGVMTDRPDLLRRVLDVASARHG